MPASINLQMSCGSGDEVDMSIAINKMKNLSLEQTESVADGVRSKATKIIRVDKGKGLQKKDLNTAKRHDIESLFNWGPGTTELIMKNRPFKDWDEVRKVKGLGEGRTDDLKSRFVIGEQPCESDFEVGR